MAANQKITRSFPVTSPIYEVRQFRKSRQTIVETLAPADAKHAGL